MISPWIAKGQISEEDYKIFKLKRIFRENSVLNKSGIFTLVDSPNWVNIIAETDEEKIVFVRQYRFGNEEITIELPGGLIDINEDSLEAAKRECQEETGYFSEKKPELIGVSSPNPAFMNNKCFTYLWKSCSKMYEQNLDFCEDIEVLTFTRSEVISKIRSGEINHSIILSALMMYFSKDLAK